MSIVHVEPGVPAGSPDRATFHVNAIGSIDAVDQAKLEARESGWRVKTLGRVVPIGSDTWNLPKQPDPATERIGWEVVLVAWRDSEVVAGRPNYTKYPKAWRDAVEGIPSRDLEWAFDVLSKQFPGQKLPGRQTVKYWLHLQELKRESEAARVARETHKHGWTSHGVLVDKDTAQSFLAQTCDCGESRRIYL